MKKKHIVFAAVFAAVILLIILLGNFRRTESVDIETETKKGIFEVNVTVTGELQARNSVKIEAPFQILREVQLWEISIGEMVPEGTVVDSGDFVARLNASEVENRLKDIEAEIDNSLAEIEKAKIDSSLELRSQRDNIINLRYSVQEAEITLEQSKFESPSVIRKAQIDLDRIKREYDQTLGNYKLKVQQAEVNIRQKNFILNKRLRQKEKIYEAMKSLIIKAPAAGMVIYRKERDGTKVVTGSSIQIWRNAIVATLPDLSSFNSITYVNEIDISKVKTGQLVKIGIDAFPDKKFTGVVHSVANIGEQLQNADAKLFEVIIRMNETDPVLRPSMTSSNQVTTNIIDDAVYVPLEAVHTVDSLTFIYKKNKTRQLVLLGEANEDHVIVNEGLKEGDKILLSVPEKADDYKLTGTELIPKIKAQLLEKQKNNMVQPNHERKERKNGNRPDNGRPQNNNNRQD
ncbi:MAG: efflux RND transporter periplasmic adaptor subunit [Bacteroidales bacterium]|nr:efflux RND transporter periplasmic adaptor subunit [Bacteroidales bacterium]